MNGAWLILDSLSFDATPFAYNGPDTMPNYADFVKEKGVNYLNAYAPGPFSPSSHACFFTGQLPSATGMYEAYPRFTGTVPTIGNVVSQTHDTHLISTNQFLFQGLHEGFDETSDLGRRYMVFQDASDPMDYTAKYNDDPRWKRYLDFLRDAGKPIKSLANGLNYVFGRERSITPKSWGDEENFQYASTMCDMIRRRLSGDQDTFIVANFMDLHSPFEVSDEALERYFPNTPRDEIPLGVTARRDKLRGQKSYDPEKMYTLYKAAIWDFDRKFTPLVEELVADDTFVAVFADHGWYDTNSAYSDERLHVPLTLFAPGESAREVDYTVSLKSLPRTTAEVMLGTDGGFDGSSLLEVTEDQPAVTEIIHKPNEIYEKTLRIYVNRPSDGATPDEIQHDVVLYLEGAKVQFVADDYEAIRGTAEQIEELVMLGRKVRSGPVVYPDGAAEEYDDSTKERLKRLGYLS